ncbi:MAG: DUF4136 domain-containing protein, partial [Woeseiaceae bacterium]|nr:DUF4136 domain-containing protein [Woeseiaceae bacterium]
MRIANNSHAYSVGLLATAMIVAACTSGPRIVTNSDPAADWSSYRTFGFFQPLGTDRGDVRSLMSNQLIDSTTREMQAAGYTLTDANPDLMINFVVS